jgi:tetratricopeptide (TPR) repeat protein
MWANLGDAYKYSGNQALAKQAYETALGLVERNLQVNPSDPLLQSMKIRFLSELNNCDSVMEGIQQLQQLPAQDPYIFYNQALTYVRCKRPDLAKESIQLAISSGYPIELLAKDVQFDDLLDYITQLQQGANE